MLRKLHTNPSNFWGRPKKNLEGFVWSFVDKGNVFFLWRHTLVLYWWEYSRTSMCDYLPRRKPPPPISDHQSKTPKFSQSKPYSWNLSQTATSCERPQPFLRLTVLEIEIAFNTALLSDWPPDTIFWSLFKRYRKSYTTPDSDQEKNF